MWMGWYDNSNAVGDHVDIAVTMAGILGSMMALLAGLVCLQSPSLPSPSSSVSARKEGAAVAVAAGTATRPGHGRFLACAEEEPSKRAYELFVAYYSAVWMTAMGIVVVTGWYEHFTAWTYLYFCGGLALPLLLQPLLLFTWKSQSPDALRPLHQRYCFKANVWLAVYSFIGNYWYTHYFYSVLQASYSMPAHRLNNVPIAFIFATHFYFSTYHFFSNALLRYIVTAYQPGLARKLLFVATILVFSYFTAFMETLSISSYPYYSFQDRTMAYKTGSAFYGIYFLVSFPSFFYFDRHIDTPSATHPPITVWDTLVQSCGYGMIILCLLDFVRLGLGVPLLVGTETSITQLFDSKCLCSASAVA